VIALLDYGAGNLTSVRKALAAVGAEHFTPSSPAELAGTTGIVIPGVGHFGATRSITAEWRQAILREVEGGAPLLGICLGMQYLFDDSEEAAGVSGLGLLRGRCSALPSIVKVPHVGWNSLKVQKPSALLDASSEGAQVYFTHSYAAPVTTDTVATTEHGASFAAVVERGPIFGVQFHPEKSSDAGLRVLRAFVDITKCSPSA
jgi:imidazole glycerol-phosphate synthase subunit HisH